MHKIGITGSSGFVGKNFINYLGYGDYEISPIDRNQLGNVQTLNPAFTEIVHLAGKAHDLKKVSDPNEYYEVNFELTKKLFDAFLKSEAKKFIFISSVKAVADTVDGVLSEDVIPNPQTPYGKSKLMAEEYIRAQELPEGKSYYILRPCMIHGPGNKGNLNLLYKFVEKGIPYPLAAFKNKRSFLSVENLCFVIEELIVGSIPSGIYNVADDERLSTNDLVKEIAIALNLKPRLWRISSDLIKSLAKIGDQLKLPLTTERLTKLTENYEVSNQKIKTAFGRALPVSARDGLRSTIKSFTK